MMLASRITWWTAELLKKHWSTYTAWFAAGSYWNHINTLNNEPLNLVATWSKAWVCNSSLAEIAGLNPAGGMDVYLLWVLSIVRQRSLRWANPTSREVLLSVIRCNYTTLHLKWVGIRIRLTKKESFLCFVDCASTYNLTNNPSKCTILFKYIYLFFFSTCFWHPSAHHQEKITVFMRHWYLSLWMGGVWSAG